MLNRIWAFCIVLGPNRAIFLWIYPLYWMAALHSIVLLSWGWHVSLIRLLSPCVDVYRLWIEFDLKPFVISAVRHVLMSGFVFERDQYSCHVFPPGCPSPPADTHAHVFRSLFSWLLAAMQVARVTAGFSTPVCVCVCLPCARWAINTSLTQLPPATLAVCPHALTFAGSRSGSVVRASLQSSRGLELCIMPL